MSHASPVSSRQKPKPKIRKKFLWCYFGCRGTGRKRRKETTCKSRQEYGEVFMKQYCSSSLAWTWCNINITSAWILLSVLCMQSWAIASRENSEVENEGLILCARNYVISMKKKGTSTFIHISFQTLGWTHLRYQVANKPQKTEKFLVQHKAFELKNEERPKEFIFHNPLTRVFDRNFNNV